MNNEKRKTLSQVLQLCSCAVVQLCGCAVVQSCLSVGVTLFMLFRKVMSNL